jgi:hypothetical protein
LANGISPRNTAKHPQERHICRNPLPHSRATRGEQTEHLNLERPNLKHLSQLDGLPPPPRKTLDAGHSICFRRARAGCPRFFAVRAIFKKASSSTGSCQHPPGLILVPYSNVTTLDAVILGLAAVAFLALPFILDYRRNRRRNRLKKKLERRKPDDKESR